MSDTFERAIEVALAQISELEAQVTDHKRTVNGLCRLASKPAMFPDASPASLALLRDDEFYGKPLATAVQEVLERRKLSGQGAATVADIYDTLVRGGFHFATKNVENAKRNLYQNLSKNSKFHKLPNGSYGLTEWYPNARKPRDDQINGTEAKPNEPEEGDSEQEPGAAEAKQTFEDKKSEANEEVVSAKAKSR
jgi:DNA-directed RNA polymerase delta subunit